MFHHFITYPSMFINKKFHDNRTSTMSSVAGPLIVKDNILRVMQNASLVLHVYCEKLKEDSFWKPYLGILNNTYSFCSLSHIVKLSPF